MKIEIHLALRFYFFDLTSRSVRCFSRLESDLPVDPMQPHDNLGQPSAYASRFWARHKERGNIAFVDGHADFKPGAEVVDRGYAFYSQTTVVWTIDPERNPNE